MGTLVEPFKDIAGEELRVVAVLDSVDYEVAYFRTDLEDQYDETDLDRAYQSMMANQVSSADFAGVGAFGELNAQVLFFEEIVVFLFPTSRYSSVFVSFEREGTEESFSIREVIRVASEHPEISGDSSTER